MSGFYLFLSVTLYFVLEAMKICYLDNIILIIEETVFLYSLFFWEEIHRWIPVFHQLRKTQCSWEDKSAGGFKKALKSVCSFHTVGIPAQYMFFDLASTCGLRIYFFLQLQTNMQTFLNANRHIQLPEPKLYPGCETVWKRSHWVPYPLQFPQMGTPLLTYFDRKLKRTLSTGKISEGFPLPSGKERCSSSLHCHCAKP